MRKPLLTIKYIERSLAHGESENLIFNDGVNLLIGLPSTGKTKWMETLDYVLGDSGDHPFAESEDMLADKYDSMSAGISFGDDVVYRLDRRWREPGAKSKVFIDDEPISTKEFQHWLLNKLNIPLLHYPKGNPMSGQTWPELSFRSMYRHMYRQQRFWINLVDQQPEAEQLACIQNFLGVADQIYTDEYGKLVNLKREAEKLEARRAQYNDTLNALASDLIADESLTVSVTPVSIAKARKRNQQNLVDLQEKKMSNLKKAQLTVIGEEDQSYVESLAKERADLVHKLENNRKDVHNIEVQIMSLERLRTTLLDEVDRIQRATDASYVLSDLKITHCPSCDQSVSNVMVNLGHCVLCHQSVDNTELTVKTGEDRIKFESDRLKAEISEADELLKVAKEERNRLGVDNRNYGEMLKRTEVQLHPARTLVGAFVQEDISQIDLEIGQLNERSIQLDRVESAIGLDVALAEKIADIEKKIRPLTEAVEKNLEAADFDDRASWLEEGMNEYLNAINTIRPKTWRHNPLGVYLSKSTFSLRIGNKRWKRVLGGTDTLYVLMAYQYGLLSLIRQEKSNFPGLLVIDTPAEFVGVELGDKLNFIVQPFIDLLKELGGGQMIITGASFDGIKEVSEHRLSKVHVS